MWYEKIIIFYLKFSYIENYIVKILEYLCDMLRNLSFSANSI